MTEDMISKIFWSDISELDTNLSIATRNHLLNKITQLNKVTQLFMFHSAHTVGNPLCMIFVCLFFPTTKRITMFRKRYEINSKNAGQFCLPSKMPEHFCENANTIQNF